MSMIRRLGAAAAAVVMAGGLTFAGAQTATAADWDGHETYTAAQVKEVVALQGAAADVTCAFFPGGWGVACSIAGALATANQFKDAANKDCGLTVSWRATGSGMSYDKAEYKYTQNC